DDSWYLNANLKKTSLVIGKTIYLHPIVFAFKEGNNREMRNQLQDSHSPFIFSCCAKGHILDLWKTAEKIGKLGSLINIYFVCRESEISLSYLIKIETSLRASLTKFDKSSLYLYRLTDQLSALNRCLDEKVLVLGALKIQDILILREEVKARVFFSSQASEEDLRFKSMT